MGLLDDAIREHLELKRLSGADPGVVAREEKDALGQVRHLDHDRHGGAGGSEINPPLDAGESSSSVSELASSAADSSTAGQETVEINMDAELDAAADLEREPQTTSPEQPAPVTHAGHTQTDSLEWEVPGDLSSELADSASPKDGSDLSAGDDDETAEHIEDVLEETPDFLRDTPEQERLWFEQRPPRDFDFNE